jgi:hypothetical protein
MTLNIAFTEINKENETWTLFFLDKGVIRSVIKNSHITNLLWYIEKYTENKGDKKDNELLDKSLKQGKVIKNDRLYFYYTLPLSVCVKLLDNTSYTKLVKNNIELPNGISIEIVEFHYLYSEECPKNQYIYAFIDGKISDVYAEIFTKDDEIDKKTKTSMEDFKMRLILKYSSSKVEHLEEFKKLFESFLDDLKELIKKFPEVKEAFTKEYESYLTDDEE